MGTVNILLSLVGAFLTMEFGAFRFWREAVIRCASKSSPKQGCD